MAQDHPTYVETRVDYPTRKKKNPLFAQTLVKMLSVFGYSV